MNHLKNRPLILPGMNRNGTTANESDFAGTQARSTVGI
jgi:hypothetical protein